MRTRWKWAVLALVFAMIAAACGGDDDGADDTTAATDAPTTSADDDTSTTALGDTTATTAGATTTDAMVDESPAAGVDLALWGWSSSDAENSALSGLVGQFNADTGANAAFQPQAEFDATLQAALAGGEPPDVFYVDSFRLADLADAGALAPVPDGAISNPDDIYGGLRDAFTYNNTWYCPPKDFSTLALVYDPDVLDEAGIAPPTTWDELAAAAEALTTGAQADVATGAAQAGLAMGVEYPRWGVFLFQAGAALTANGDTEIGLDNDGGRAALQLVADLYQNGHAVNPGDVDAGWAGEAFGQGKAAMTIEGNWIVGYLQDTFPDKNFAVAELPVGPSGPGTFAFTVCYGVPAAAENPDASWALVEYLTNAEGALAWTEAFNVMPARASVAADWLAPRPEFEAFVAGGAYANRWGFAPGVGDLVGVFNENASFLTTGEITVDEMIEELLDAGEDILG